jgi:hypothetical protein
MLKFRGNAIMKEISLIRGTSKRREAYVRFEYNHMLPEVVREKVLPSESAGPPYIPDNEANNRSNVSKKEEQRSKSRNVHLLAVPVLSSQVLQVHCLV